MSDQVPASPSAVPEWTLADRLRKARISAGFEQEDLEALTGISRKSISNYETGKTVPNRPVLTVWAMTCGVPYEWLAGTGPTLRGRRRKRPPPGRRVAALVPLLTAAVAYLAVPRELAGGCVRNRSPADTRPLACTPRVKQLCTKRPLSLYDCRWQT